MLGGILMGLPMVLLPAQILLVNLVTDSLPAIALGLEPAESSVMKKPPRKEDDSFFSGGLMWRIVIRGLLIGICTLASFTVLLTNTHSLGTARTGALITLVLSQLIHVFECKSEDKTLFTVPYLSNPFLLFSVFISASAVCRHMAPCSAKGIFHSRSEPWRVSCGGGSGGYRACWGRNNTKAFYGQKVS
jgi:Ca2+-transporting ATPase